MRSTNKSLRKIDVKMNLNRETTRLISKDIGAFSNNIQKIHKLNISDKRLRVEYCARILSRQYEDK